MLKFILIVVLISYTLYRVIDFFMKVLSLGGNASNSHRQEQTRTNSGNIHVDYVPKDKTRKGNQSGEYIDYEEVD